MKTYRTARAVLEEVKRRLARTPAQRENALASIAETLHDGRNYFWTGIYLLTDGELRRAAFSGPEAPDASACSVRRLGQGNIGVAAQTGAIKVSPDVSADPDYFRSFAETKSEIAVPIRVAGRVLGVLNAESDQVNGFAAEDRVLLKETAQALAHFLTGVGRSVLLKARAGAAQGEKTNGARFRPRGERPEKVSRAAAGDKTRR